ncbi:spore germination protein [Bacillus sp. EB600]|uniref:spore germination protein n=1 Tax=Bacillus sp. EB600 TaxID=2806345 RepID=UPI00210D0192|nr:spore germination protein [Bacillus sp. EB600]MCQ6282479.1 spore germination protein [Bacillus sp. EB600]
MDTFDIENGKFQSKETIDWLSIQLKPTFDLIEKRLEHRKKGAKLLFIKTLVDGDKVQQMIIKPFFEMDTEDDMRAYLSSLPDQQETTSKEQILGELTKGSVVVGIHGLIFMFDMKTVNTNTVPPTLLETTIQGPQMSLSEDIQTNVNLIRHRYHQPSLSVEMFEVGEKSNQSLAVIYDRDLVNQAVLQIIKTKISNLKEPIVQSTAELQRMMNEEKYSLFPSMIITERTDRIVYNLSGGKVVLLLDGNPTTIIAPTVFFDFMSAMDDNYNSYWVTKFSRIIRYMGLFTSLILPGFYVASTSFNPEILQSQLALSVAGSRLGVPYPSYMEVLFMLIFMELLIEASIRLPRVISGAATTVGGLILGTAATEATLASNIMIIVVAAVAICNFAIPISGLNYAVRVLKYIVIFFASIAGVAGLLLSFIGIVMYLTHLRSFGEPYLKLYMQRKTDEKKGM